MSGHGDLVQRRIARLTLARRKGLMALMHGRRTRREVTESNVTTSANRYDTEPLYVYWQTALWLTESGYITRTMVTGRHVLELTDAGVALAEEQGL